jgi:hypothetical protein
MEESLVIKTIEKIGNKIATCDEMKKVNHKCQNVVFVIFNIKNQSRKDFTLQTNGQIPVPRS